jgi:hypothetical protein
MLLIYLGVMLGNIARAAYTFGLGVDLGQIRATYTFAAKVSLPSLMLLI